MTARLEASMDELGFARELCAEAGKILLARRRAGDLGRIDQKASPTDLVTAVDHELDALITGRILERFPDHCILSEEQGAIGSSGSEHQWILDPLDGTRNFVHGFPFFSISLGLVVGGVPEVGVVEAPYLRESFWARRGKGAFLNGEPIHVSGRSQLEAALFATGFACVRSGRKPDNIPVLLHVLERTRDIRRAGSAAIDLCYVACGRLDGFWEMELSPWDVAAGGLIVREAGGRVSDFSGGNQWLFGHEMLATNTALHEILRGEIHAAWGEA